MISKEKKGQMPLFCLILIGFWLYNKIVQTKNTESF
nr:MAG TPA: Membrane fusion protein p14 fusion protein transmembrane domain [Caudoviricetes sp.]